jgi:hypothetical protein
MGRCFSRVRRMALWGLFPTAAVSVWAITPPADVAHAAGQAGPTMQAEEHIKQLVVMLQGTLAEQSFNGAGIIVGRTSERLYIATAHHVVRQATQQAERVEAQFRWLPGEWKKVSVLADGDVDLDLGMLAVDAREVPNSDLAWAVLADPNALEPGAKVFPIGFPNAMPWFRPQQPQIINRVSAQHIHTEGQVFPGNSGGALVTEDWRLVGLVSNVSAVLAASTRMDRIVEKLQEWRYPVGLTLATSRTPTQPKPTQPDAELKPSDSGFGGCSVAGVVVDAGRGSLSGVNVGLAARMPGSERYETITRTAAVTGRDGTFRFDCPGGIARERFPVRLIVWHSEWRMKYPNIQIQADEKLANVEIPVSVLGTIGSKSADDCIAIRPGALRVENHGSRGGWHVVEEGPSGGQVLPPDFETNENGARTVALVLQKYNVTQYCQVGSRPVVFYFLSRGAPVLMSTPGRGGPDAGEVGERCRAINQAALAVVGPDTMTGSDWSIRESGRIVFRVSDEALGRRMLAMIRRHGFTSVCYPGRPMLYLR